ncbi:MAG: DUF2808 domain-containing protein [Cyanobium sp.]
MGESRSPARAASARPGRQAAGRIGLVLAATLALGVEGTCPGQHLGAGVACDAGAAQAVEIGGASLFVKAPWKVDLISYYTTVGQPQPEYYLTLELDPDAGASLASFSFQQIRGADWQFPFSPQRTYAFLGRPRQQGKPVPVRASWDDRTRTMVVSFPEPVPPGSTITTVLIPWFNPMQSDTYLFQVVAFPSGPNPVGSTVGVGTLRIYQYSNW